MTGCTKKYRESLLFAIYVAYNIAYQSFNSILFAILLPFTCYNFAISFKPYASLLLSATQHREAGAIASRGAYQKTLSLVRKAKSPS